MHVFVYFRCHKPNIFIHIEQYKTQNIIEESLGAEDTDDDGEGNGRKETQCKFID